MNFVIWFGHGIINALVRSFPSFLDISLLFVCLQSRKRISLNYSSSSPRITNCADSAQARDKNHWRGIPEDVVDRPAFLHTVVVVSAEGQFSLIYFSIFSCKLCLVRVGLLLYRLASPFQHVLCALCWVGIWYRNACFRDCTCASMKKKNFVALSFENTSRQTDTPWL